MSVGMLVAKCVPVILHMRHSMFLNVRFYIWLISSAFIGKIVLVSCASYYCTTNGQIMLIFLGKKQLSSKFRKLYDCKH